MNWDWYNALMAMLSTGQDFFQMLIDRSETDRFDPFLTGLSMLFTPSQASMTFLLLLFVLLVLRDRWLMEFIGIVFGKMIGMMVVFLLYIEWNVESLMNGIAVFRLVFPIAIMGFGSRTIILRITDSPFLIKKSGFLLGLTTAFYVGPVAQQMIMASSYQYFGTDVIDFVGSAILISGGLLLPLLLLAAVLFGFNIDLLLKGKKKVYRSLSYIFAVLILLIGVNEVIIYWSGLFVSV